MASTYTGLNHSLGVDPLALTPTKRPRADEDPTLHVGPSPKKKLRVDHYPEPLVNNFQHDLTDTVAANDATMDKTTLEIATWKSPPSTYLRQTRALTPDEGVREHTSVHLDCCSHATADLDKETRQLEELMIEQNPLSSSYPTPQGWHSVNNPADGSAWVVLYSPEVVEATDDGDKYFDPAYYLEHEMKEHTSSIVLQSLADAEVNTPEVDEEDLMDGADRIETGHLDAYEVTNVDQKSQTDSEMRVDVSTGDLIMTDGSQAMSHEPTALVPSTISVFSASRITSTVPVLPAVSIPSIDATALIGPVSSPDSLPLKDPILLSTDSAVSTDVEENGCEWVLIGDDFSSPELGIPAPKKLVVHFRHKITKKDEVHIYSKKHGVSLDWNNTQHIQLVHNWRRRLFRTKGMVPIKETSTYAPDEEAYLELFYEKVKATIIAEQKKSNGASIILPHITAIAKVFNSFFMGKILKDQKGHDLPPRKFREYPSFKNKIGNKNGKINHVRAEVGKLIEGQAQTHAYLPIITVHELLEFREGKMDVQADLIE
ncbi:hypothetical protein BDV95DRAFT_604550 [Massariosphaeria phaeospora]|uniref:Uncharacterized protein n=1 Tax=Massariosphaeria phaeospora TaxID=100035 RepID=A0A7C8MPZ2_9PLEO|nr:hypothetical protein BDV95DRAFT_604550 [Massariosphaeria phaeospora]